MVKGGDDDVIAESYAEEECLRRNQIQIPKSITNERELNWSHFFTGPQAGAGILLACIPSTLNLIRAEAQVLALYPTVPWYPPAAVSPTPSARLLQITELLNGPSASLTFHCQLFMFAIITTLAVANFYTKIRDISTTKIKIITRE